MSLQRLEVPRPELAGLPAYDTEYLVIIDHDRTRGPVEAAMGRLLTIASLGHYGLDAGKIVDEQAAVEADGMSFNPLSGVKNQLADQNDPQTAAKIYSDFLGDFTTWQNNGNGLLYPDAVRLEARLDQPPVIPHNVMTAGKSVEWQEKKVEPDFHGYVKIIPVGQHEKTPPKGPVIAGWQDPETGLYPLVGLGTDDRPLATFNAITPYLIDDKAVSFEGIPEGGEGALLDRPEEETLRSQGSAADLPAGRKIEVIHSLDEIDLPHIYKSDVDPGVISRVAKFVPLAEYVKLGR